MSTRRIPTARTPHVVVIGSLNTDLLTRTPRIPAPGETVTGSDLLTLPGGKGANQAVAAARLATSGGPRVHMVGRVGDDDAGRRLVAGLRSDGVDTSRVRATPGVPTGSALILVDARGENSIVVSPGANARVTPADVDAALPLLRTASVVLLQLEIPLATVRQAIRVCRDLGVPTILDPAPVPPRGLPRALFKADYLTPNQPESLQLAGREPARGARVSDVKPIASDLLARGASTVVLKLGARGAAVAPRGGAVTLVRPCRVRVVDSTAAGDAFNGALAVALSEGKPLPEAVRFANAAGALCCTKRGSQPALPHRREVDRLVSGMHLSSRGRLADRGISGSSDASFSPRDATVAEAPTG
jgi:ribokinase